MAAVASQVMMGPARSDETHPFFQSRAIPHRAVKSAEIGDDGDSSSQPAKSYHFISRTRKSEPLVERASDTHIPQNITDDSSGGAQTDEFLVVETKQDKTPTTKVLKLNSNGKLLSSPPALPMVITSAGQAITTPPKSASKRTKARSSKSTSFSLIAKIGYGRENADERLRVGSSIDKLLGSRQKLNHSQNSSPPKKKKISPQKPSHPFFSSTAKPLSSAVDVDNQKKEKTQGSDLIVSPARIASRKQRSEDKPAWKDIVFLSGRNPNQHNEHSPAPWPPTNMQRVDDLLYTQNVLSHATSSIFQKHKLKGRASQFPEEEDVLRRASHVYSESWQKTCHNSARYPTRTILSGKEMIARLENKVFPVDRMHPATKRLQSSLTTTLTAFDQGRCDRLSWVAKSSPSNAEEVLQNGPEAILLRDWIKTLMVTSVEGAQPPDKPKITKTQVRKRGRPKRGSDVDDFIVPSEDEADELTEINQSTWESSPFIEDVKRSVLRAGVQSSSQDKVQTKNTLLVSGPTGCGKTASIYAVAKELSFEVFEINPGSRRGAKEILERVGNMTQNHLVQQHSKDNSADESPATPIDDAAVQNEVASGIQRTMNGFFSTQSKTVSKVGRKRKAVQQDDQNDETASKKPRKAQKQSLILLEEVDVLFEDDKSFWSGVMSLINQSKRPIILTCNDESALPLDELPLHGILRYSSPSQDMATNYLLTLAANEGHELERDAVSYLYRSQKHDLRASITALDFWCQMGIGSRKGGLDWMLERRRSTTKTTANETKPRVFSTNTYLSGMGLTPHQPEIDSEQLVFDAYQQLDIPLNNWCFDACRTVMESNTALDASLWSDLYSDLDLYQQIPFDINPSNLHLRIAASLTTRLSSTPLTSTSITNVHIQPTPYPFPLLTRANLTQILSPLSTERNPSFPPPQGRLAPTLDSPTSILTTDLAPYIRSIVAYEQKWGATALLPTQRRSTRASRTPEGYLPKKLNGEYVMRTGGTGWQDLVWEKSKPGEEEEEMSMVGDGDEKMRSDDVHVDAE